MASLRQCPTLLLLAPVLITTLSTFLFSPVLGTVDPATQASIDQICRNTEDYGFCNNLYQDKLKGKPSDMHGLAYIAQEQANLFLGQVHSAIENMLANATGAEKDGLTKCKTAYDKVVGIVGNAWSLFKAQNYLQAVTVEGTAPKEQAVCSSALIEPPLRQSPIYEQNRQERILITMSILSTSYLVKQLLK